MKALAPFIALLAMLAFGTTARAQFSTTNLLLNGGAETGNLSAWVQGGASNPIVVASNDSVYHNFLTPTGGGGFMFYGGTGAAGSLTQTVSLIGNQGITVSTIDTGNAFANVTFSEKGLNQGDPSDNGYVSLTFLNSSLGVISTSLTPVIDYHPSEAVTWQSFSQSFAIPVGTRSVLYTINFTRNAVTNIDAFFDLNTLTVSLAAVPEPSTWVMLLTGVIGLGFLRRRRRGQR